MCEYVCRRGWIIMKGVGGISGVEVIEAVYGGWIVMK